MGLKALVIVHKDFLLTQWRERIEQFLPDARVGLIKATKFDIKHKDIVLASLQSLSMKSFDEDAFEEFGLVAADECHHLSAEVFSRALPKVTVPYMLGLSATLNRKDGLRKVFEWYLGGVVYSNSLRVAGDAMDTAIITYMRKQFNLLVGEASAEKIKKEIGTALSTSQNTFLMKGRDIRSGTPKEITLKEEDTSEALKPVLNQILAGIKDALERTPPELSADLVDMGLVLTGGGALLKNIDKLITTETGLPVQIAEDPLSCVALGTGKALDEEETFSNMLVN